MYLTSILRLLIVIIMLALPQSKCMSQPSGDENIPPAPPHGPALLQTDGNKIILTYEGNIILRLQITSPKQFTVNELQELSEGRTEQVININTMGREPVTISGFITASDESFPCEADPPTEGLIMVRHVAGLSQSLLNRAVYDRQRDWALSVDHPTQVRITPMDTSALRRYYKIEIEGIAVCIRFRPRFYQQHRGLPYFEPWTYRPWQKSVAGWCSWFAYRDKITEDSIRYAADIISEELAPYGFEYIQMDDGYQQIPAGTPDTWLIPNEKFPSGLPALSDYIRSKGLKPGIWTYTSFHQKDYVLAHKKYFVLDKMGNPAKGFWVGYPIDGSNPVAIDSLIRPVYQGFRESGWSYFKVDALRHLRYEGYNTYADYFTERGIDRVEAYRNVVKAIREEVGRDCFLLGCWGIRPELTGIIDGCRIGGDGFGYAGLAQYNSFNNIVWRNDPDHIELTPEEAYRSCMVTSLTGSLFMLTDKPDVYLTPLAEPARRSVPVLYTVPGQLFDVDPSRSSHLDRAAAEVSGNEERLLDANRIVSCNLFLLEINKPFGNWILLGITRPYLEPVYFRDLGLDEEQEYLVFEFWSKEFRGIFKKLFIPGVSDTIHNCQLFCIRTKQDHPQLMATNRHITCGGYDLKEHLWDGVSLTGTSRTVNGESYILYIFEPEGFLLESQEIQNGRITEVTKDGPMRTITIKPKEGGEITWRLNYDH